MGRAVGCALLLLWAVSSLLSADPRDQFAQETGLDPDLVNLIKVDVGGTELTVTFVVINERTFQSKISLELSILLQPYVGLNAIYVNPSIDAVVGSFAFDPQFISVQQSGVTSFLPWEVWDEITPGFLSGRFEVNPSGPSQGSGSEGVVILGDLIDPQLPFDVLYAGARASFEISSPSALAAVAQTTTGSPTAAIQSHDPIEIAPLETLDALQDLLLHEDFSSEAMAALFELDPKLVRTIVLTPRGDELRLFFVRLEESIRTSLLGAELIASIDELIGTEAIMVWAISPSGVAFSPWHLYVWQGTAYPIGYFSNPFIELTEGFSRSVILEANQVVAGAFQLPGGVDIFEPFSICYGNTCVDYP